MTAWKIYAKERFPLAPNLLISAGLALSAGALRGGSFRLRLPALALIGIVLALYLAWLINNAKDLDKDLVRKTVSAGETGMIAFALILYALRGVSPAVAYLGVVLFLHIMFKTFLTGRWEH